MGSLQCLDILNISLIFLKHPVNPFHYPLQYRLIFRELQNSQTVLNLVKQFGVLKAIGALFIKYSEQWLNNDKSKEKMLLDIIRVIYEYSRFKQYHSILEVSLFNFCLYWIIRNFY